VIQYLFLTIQKNSENISEKPFAVTNIITNFAHSECTMTGKLSALPIVLKINRFCQGGISYKVRDYKKNRRNHGNSHITMDLAAQ
ncbi:MAG: hypothetical protein MJ001_09415, partial [Paludibacteraceae bacterium]|nr:hypothetical protein [Paludibacteraceae bacterium]